MQIWSSLSWFESIDRMKNTEHTYTCAERALYRSAPRLCNLLRNSPPDCFCQICKQIWSSLSLVRVNKIAKEKPIRISVSAFFGSPSWTRTNDPAVNSRMLYRLSYWGISAEQICSALYRHFPIFPGRHRPSILGVKELNFRVRNGNGWNLLAINTDYDKKNGDPYQNRTGDAAVRGRSLNRLTNGPPMIGAPSGTRTQDPLIKSQLLYQLS